jgi:hypothetical protein
MRLVRLLFDELAADIVQMTMFRWPSKVSGGSAIMPNIRLLD